MITQRDLAELDGAEVYDGAGARIGSVGQIYVDPHHDDPLWVTVRTGSMTFQESFVPLYNARIEAGRLIVGFDEALIRQAPLLNTDSALEYDEAEHLYAHYGLTPDARSRDVAGPGQKPAEDDAMTRSEERLVVSTQREPVTRARLRKYVVTEQRQITVPVRREEVRVEHVPVTDGEPGEESSGSQAGDADATTTLHAEQPVVNVETVPVERVRLSKQTVRGEETVTGNVRKERIDFAGPDAADPDNPPPA